MAILVFTLAACAMVVVAVVSETVRALRHDDFHDIEAEMHWPFKNEDEELRAMTPKMPDYYDPEDWE